jgi:hypothetical protein
MLQRTIDCADSVTQTGGILETFVLRCIRHQPFKIFSNSLGVAAKESDQTLHVSCIGIRGDLFDTWSRTLLDVEQQTRATETFMLTEFRR